MDRADEEKPTDPTQILSDEFAMRAQRFPQSFVVKRERDLHGTKDNN